MSRYLDRQSTGPDYRPKTTLQVTDDAEAGLIARQSLLRSKKSGRCNLARRRLKHVFHMRKYYRSVMGLTGFEVLLVIVRMILETESLRVAPGNTRNAILSTQLGLFCISLFTLSLFVVEQPFKWWALGSRRFCTSVLFVLDAIACCACFSLNIYNIHANVTRPQPELNSPKQLIYCQLNQLTSSVDSSATFSIAGGLVIVFRLWCITGYIQKSVQTATATITQKANGLQRENEETQIRVNQLESMLREQEAMNRSLQSRSSTRTTGQTNTNTRSSSNRRSRSTAAS